MEGIDNMLSGFFSLKPNFAKSLDPSSKDRFLSISFLRGSNFHCLSLSLFPIPFEKGPSSFSSSSPFELFRGPKMSFLPSDI